MKGIIYQGFKIAISFLQLVFFIAFYVKLRKNLLINEGKIEDLMKTTLILLGISLVFLQLGPFYFIQESHWL
jgi:hypothetical protein